MVVGFFESLPSFVKTLPDTKQLDYIVNQLKWMEENFEGDENHHRLRKAAMETVLRYSVQDNPFYNDERLFHVFCIVGKLSRTMGMKSVMEELHNRKQFYELAEFYVKWGEIFAEEKDRERFNEIWNKAIKANARPASRVDEAFRAMLYQYFEMDDEMTVNLFKKPDSSKNSPVVFRAAETATLQQKGFENGERISKLTYSGVKGHLKIVDEQHSIEEIFAEAGNYAAYTDVPRSRMSISKLSAISEERSGCASGSLINPSHNVELKLMQPSAGDAVDDLFQLAGSAAAENDVLVETDAFTGKTAECPQSSHLTLHGTSFTERFLSKAMRDFSSTVPVPPPRSVHHDADETTVLHETIPNESELVHLPSASKKRKFEVYVEGNLSVRHDSAKGTAPFTVYSDENTLPPSVLVEKRIIVEQDLDYEKSINIHDNDTCEVQPTFRKPATIAHSRRSSVFGKAASTSHEQNNEILVEVEQQKGTKLPLPDRVDEETLAGLNKMAKTGAVTSTPASTFAPPIEDPMKGSPPSSAADHFFQKAVFDEVLTANTAFGRRMSMSEQRRDTLTKLSQKIGVENIVGNKRTTLSANGNINEELRRLSLAPSEEDTNEPTSEGLKSNIESEINPWDEKLRNKIMASRRFCPTNVHDFPEKCSRLNPGAALILGGERFDVECLIGEGGFAKVYKSKSEDGSVYAVKFEMPACRWEVYACETLRNRMPKMMLEGIMNIRDAYIFLNASAIVYEYHSYGNLLDMVNKLQAKKMSCSGLLATYLGWEIGRILEAVHNAQIIHGDVKPDNFMILHRLNEDAKLEQILDKNSFTLKLIDWGRAIDMSYFKGCTFRGKAGTVAFDCSEMQDGRPWTYQTDFYGFISTLHVVIYGKYMKTFRNTSGRYSATSVMKRRWPQKELLEDIFDMCMNIPDCESFPKWSTMTDGLENSIKYWVTEDRAMWKQAARELNAGITP